MRGQSLVARRYAKALYEVARERNIVADVEGELKALVAAIANEPKFREIVYHPGISTDGKVEAIQGAFGGTLSEPMTNLVRLLFDRGRDKALEDLLFAYEEIVNERSGLVTATVETPAAITEEEAKRVEGTFSKLTGKTIRLHNVINPSLIGGVRVKIGDRLYDGSLSGKLAAMEKALKQS